MPFLRFDASVVLSGPIFSKFSSLFKISPSAFSKVSFNSKSFDLDLLDPALFFDLTKFGTFSGPYTSLLGDCVLNLFFSLFFKELLVFFASLFTESAEEVLVEDFKVAVLLHFFYFVSFGDLLQSQPTGVETAENQSWNEAKNAEEYRENEPLEVDVRHLCVELFEPIRKSLRYSNLETYLS